METREIALVERRRVAHPEPVEETEPTAPPGDASREAEPSIAGTGLERVPVWIGMGD